MEWSLAIVALSLLLVAAVSRRLSGTPATPAMVFVAVGLLVGPQVLDGIDLESSSATCRALFARSTATVLLACWLNISCTRSITCSVRSRSSLRSASTSRGFSARSMSLRSVALAPLRY